MRSNNPRPRDRISRVVIDLDGITAGIARRSLLKDWIWYCRGCRRLATSTVNFVSGIGGPMLGRLLTIIAATTLISAEPLRAADRRLTALPYGNCHDVWTCGRAGCRIRHICPRACPDRYSCYPLYGAYGPYGGVGYWAAYTSGWGYRW